MVLAAGPSHPPQSGPEEVLDLSYLKCGPVSGSSCRAVCLLSPAEPGPQLEIEIPAAAHFVCPDTSAIRHRTHGSGAKNTPDICEGL